MSSPAELIAALDAALADVGEDVVIIKNGDSPPVTVRASVRPVSASEVVGTIKQTHSTVILSPTGLEGTLPLRVGDKCTIAGRQRQIDLYGPIVVGGEIVRVELKVAG